MGKEKKHKREKRKKDKKHHKKSKRRHSSPEAPKVEAPKVEAPRMEGPAPKRARTDEADYSVPLPPGFTPPPAPMAPMTKQQWEAKQSVVRRVLDPQTGRHRLIRGEGEVIEEPVSRERQKQINKLATRADGDSFQRGVVADLSAK